MKKKLSYFNKQGLSNIISIIAVIISAGAFLFTIYSLWPKHGLSYIVKTSLDYANLNEENKIEFFLNSPNYILFFNTGNRTESVLGVNFLLIKNDTSKVIQKNNLYAIEPFILESGKTKNYPLIDYPIANVDESNPRSFSVSDLRENQDKGILKIEVTYIGKKGVVLTHSYSRNLKDIFSDLSFTNKMVKIE